MRSGGKQPHLTKLHGLQNHGIQAHPRREAEPEHVGGKAGGQCVRVQPAEQDIEAQREHHGCYTGQDCFFGIGACISDRVKGLRGAGQPPPARAPFLQVSMRTLAHLPAPERDIRMIQTAPMGSYDLGERGQNFEQL